MFTLNIWQKYIIVAAVVLISSVLNSIVLAYEDELLNKQLLLFSVVVFFIVSVSITYIWHAISKNSNLWTNHHSHDNHSSSTLEKRYRNFAEAEIHGNEAERLRLARELHDDTISRLIIIGQRMELLKLDHQDDDIVEGIEELIAITNGSIDHIRSVIKELRPSHLRKMGLVTAIDSLVREKHEEAAYTVGFEVHGNEYRLNDSTELTIYRLAQTALQNVRLHSECNEAWVNLRFEETELILSVEDNGAGFDVPEENELFEHAHYGLLGMKERAELCNGKFMIHSIKDAGTCVTLEIPKAGNL